METETEMPSQSSPELFNLVNNQEHKTGEIVVLLLYRIERKSGSANRRTQV
jgi:hypothetical protein